MTTHILSQAPAKINLRLKVTGRRADGYHLLSMLNARIGLYDQLDFFFNSGNGQIKFESSAQSALGADDNNLVYRAARIFFEKFKIQSVDLKVRLQKNIPIGAGLGGGSSDGASTLLVLSRYFFPDISEQERIKSLSDMALSLGSDLPFFLYTGLCHVTGTGDKIRELDSNPLSKKHLLVISPQVHLSTQGIFKAFAAAGYETSREETLPDSLSYNQIIELIDNDLGIQVQESSELCRSLLDDLSRQPEVVSCVTGSGSSIFCMPRKEDNSKVLEGIQSFLGQSDYVKSIKSKIVEFL